MAKAPRCAAVRGCRRRRAVIVRWSRHAEPPLGFVEPPVVLGSVGCGRALLGVRSRNLPAKKTTRVTARRLMRSLPEGWRAGTSVSRSARRGRGRRACPSRRSSPRAADDLGAHLGASVAPLGVVTDEPIPRRALIDADLVDPRCAAAAARISPGKHYSSTGMPSRVTASPITTGGRGGAELGCHPRP